MHLSPVRSARALCGALLLVGLALGGAAVVDAIPSAEAADAAPTPFPKQGLVELLRPTDLVGDGATSADLYILALGPDGKPIQMFKPQVFADGATSVADLGPVDMGGGLYKFPLTPIKVDGPGTVTIRLKAKYPNKDPLNREWTLPVSQPRNHGMTAVANPATLTLGTDKTANVTFTLTGGDVASLARVKLGHAVSAGTFANVTNLGSGQFGGLYTVPTGLVPQVALLTAVDLADPTRTYGGVAVPLSAKVDQAVTVAPNAQVILKVAGRDFGPVTADSKGRAKVPIVIPPGTTTATRVQIVNGAPTEEPLPLNVAETRRIALFPTAAGIPSDARLQVPVRAMVVTPDGRPDETAQVAFTVSVGTVSAAKHEGGGIYVATYTPPAANTAQQATLTAKIADKAPVQTDSRPVALVPTRATKLALAAEPPTLPAAATGFAVVANVAGPDGAPLAGRALAFSANGAKLAEVKDLKNGDYRATFTTTGKGPAEVFATVAAPATNNPLAHVLLLPALERLPTDGLSSAMLTVATVDEHGYPVPNVPVDLRLLSGDGSLPTTTTTNAAGIAQVYYTAGRTNVLVSIEATAGDRLAGASLFQVAPTLQVPDLPVVGSAATKARLDELAASMAALRVERGN